ncbi:Mycothiol acetyltransferase [Pseudobythopirellula maris]|uniref:Mycothiol acetyltransferase n=1 Tax=Pseudobythopirellula maris TaxID=2527991 RepID=A0A5C5ZR62_9BACT|nr:GNAT family N-acetyltransferase [Pseudobythopirellula maris]TWT89984.1 Mycothiol acetyltransferase [Pseudobythopirellula maris]
MALTYYKRYRMAIDLRRPRRRLALPAGYRFAAWAPERLEDHAVTKHRAFCDEIDSSVFECLRSEEGCLRLMTEIARKPGFLPEATWLIERVGAPGEADECCATIQGTRVSGRMGGVQNVGVTPECRGLGLGRALVEISLRGFQLVGLHGAYLEVTSENLPAVRMYQRMGFRCVKTLYKAVDLAGCESRLV